MFDDLIDLSQAIVELSPGKPRQAHLRRAVSTAYYAVFHHLADYDLSERFRKSEVLTMIDQARAHVSSFRKLATSGTRKFFLACL